ncbi:hypothetical protein [Nocardioides sp. Soil805]|uniref:hypothetical protein n=1 Tax=Nocardioides sp. Soil805 TaxID=1736416 RepID=UPI0007037BD6|nr:hypothetical protein [Nocardioides sp. Soil805]KRF34966.1 hypothetical protein ASG94_12555 [Nocardioides sp. Soil805]
MDFLASTAIVLVGACVLVVFALVGFFGALASSPAWRWGVLLVGVGLLVLAWVLASGRGDGQPAVVYGGRRGGSDELADTDGAIGGLWLRSMLAHAGAGVVCAWLLVTLINLRNRSR